MTTQKESHQSGPGMVASNIDNPVIVSPHHFRVNDFNVLSSLAALAGYVLKRVCTGYTLTRRGVQKHFTDIEAVRELLITGGE